MCKVSDKIKLCTCAVRSADKLKHYWVLHRFNKSKNEMTIGEVVIPDMLDEKIHTYNNTLLLHRLNEADAFDVDLSPKPKDRLEITFSCPHSCNRYISYGFKYKAGKWVVCEFDSLMWSWRHDEESFGKIKQALLK